jgi:aspartyl-tRNA(Asn)/glutamyl-tRNA(Gln) amidotransferase subunit A
MNRLRLGRRAMLAGMLSGLGTAALTISGCSGRRSIANKLPTDLTQLDLAPASEAIKARLVSPVELTQACLARIGRVDPRLNSFIAVTAERALADARRAEVEVMRGEIRGPLHGVPVALKDNIDTAGIRTTAASKALSNRVPTSDAEVALRLKKTGSVLLGKLNMHEFALGTTSVISGFGPVHNPWDLDRSAGGSSGGCGAAVAGSLCFGSVGTDTGGSIRVPAAACGIVGLKPTYGVVSTAGTVPLSSTFDHVGPLCRTVADAALMFSQMTDHPVARIHPDSLTSVSRLRIGVVRNTATLCEGEVDREVNAIFEVACGVIRRLVADMRDVELPFPGEFGAVIDAEAYQYHAALLEKSSAQIDGRTLELLMVGKAMTAGDLAGIREGLQRYRSTRQDVFRQVDLVILPTLPTLPPRIVDATNPFAMGSCTFAFSVGGWPAISIPCGFSRSRMPVGMLIGGPALAEPQMLALAQAYESATQWHTMRPVL